ncbi:MAG: type VI secretion system protein TssA [Bryobacteraceae bacterium]
MPLREDLLNPIAGENPGGADLRYDPLYDKIKEARRQDDDLAQGAWQRERKLADWPLVVKLCQEAIATKSKDLQLAAWLTEALLKTQGFAGLRDGLTLCYGLVDQFWDHLYPELEDGDAEFRATPLEWIGTKLDEPVRMTPLVRDGYSFLLYRESRTVGYEDQIKNEQQKKAREKMIKEGKLAPEVFDKSFNDTPKAFYLQNEKDLDACIELVNRLDAICNEKFGDVAPSLSRFKDALEEVRHLVHSLLQKKRETEPDPVEEVPTEAEPAESEAGEAAVSAGGGAAAAPALAPAGAVTISVQSTSEPPDRREAIEAVASAAAFLRRREPLSPAPYLMLRGLRWGELRAVPELTEPTLLEAPPTDVRRAIKSLAVANKWKELIEAAESVMAMPYSRAWLDLQRFVVEACVALGDDYNAIAIAIRSELRALLRDVPKLMTATLMDDTPVANADTQAWLKSLLEEPEGAAPATKAGANSLFDSQNSAGWKKSFIDSYDLAKEALRSGQEQRAFEIMHAEVDRQRSGRGRFRRRLQLVELCVSAGKEAIAQPVLEDIAAAIETHKLEEWEEREAVAYALATLVRASKKIQGDAKEKQKLFDRICRLDPVQALNVG